MDEAAQEIEIALHAFGIDDELVDHLGEAVQREVERDRGVGADHALDRGMRDVAFVPERDVFQRGLGIAAHHAGEAGEVFRQHRVALVRHGGGALLAFGEILLGLQDFGALQVADFGGEVFDGAGDHGERCEERGVAVARDDLRRDGFGFEAQRLRDVFFDARVDLRERADGAGDGAGRDFFARGDQACAGAFELDIEARELDAERRGLGVDAVAAADGRRVA